MYSTAIKPHELLTLMTQLHEKKRKAPSPDCRKLADRLVSLSTDLDDTSQQLQHLLAQQICGDTDDSVDVEQFNDDKLMSPPLVRQCARPVAEIRWLDNLAAQFTGSGDTPGDVAGLAWGTGVLIDTDLMLTAGHLFDPVDGGVKHPKRNSVALTSKELAKLMCVRFNFQLDANGQEQPTTTFPVEELVECKQEAGVVDYALLKLGASANGESASKVFGVATLSAPDTVAKETELLCIQHRCTNGAKCGKAGVPKRVAFGTIKSNGGPFIDHLIDTKSGASGAPVMLLNGRVIAIHMQGLCDLLPGVNRAVLISAIADQSQTVRGLLK